MDIKLLNSKFDSDGEFINNQIDSTQSYLNESTMNQLLTPQDLEIKKLAILKRASNEPKIERDFRRTCLLYEYQKSSSSPQLKRAYKEYEKAYHKITTLYSIQSDGIRTYRKKFLHVFDTEKESSSRIELKVPEQLGDTVRITRLPNGELFLCENSMLSDIALIIDSTYKARILPQWMLWMYSSSTYFNRNIYLFGRIYIHNSASNFSCRFDLDRNRWVKLALMAIDDKTFHSVIFNRNILISGYKNKNLLLYSIDIDSFSIISFNFAENTGKLLIHAEKLYLIECKWHGYVYENEAGDVYSWKIIGKSTCYSSRMFGIYNKGGIYIVLETYGGLEYFKFDLSKKKMFNLYKRKNY